MLFFGVLLSTVALARASLVTYDELRRLNATCDGLDTCRSLLPHHEDLRDVNCQCGPSCVHFDTCCLDAAHTGPPKHVAGCVRPYGNKDAVFMVDKCPKDWEGDDSVTDLCVGDGQERSDLLLLVPVSNLKTGMTYRNYFCYLCNSVDDDLGDSLVSWDIGVLFSNRSLALDVDLSTLTFDKGTFQWTYPQAPSNSILHLSTEPPKKLLEKHSIFCRPDVISSCAANWTEPATRAKCGSYTALVAVLKEDFTPATYKNVHCGICNWMGTDSPVLCLSPVPSVVGGQAFAKGTVTTSAASVFKELFLVSERAPQRPCREGQMYDRVAKKCRNVKCGRKMEMVKGRCARRTT